MKPAHSSRRIERLLLSSVFAVGLTACSLFKDTAHDAKDKIGDAVSSEVTANVTDNHGQPIEGARVRLYNLLDNTGFVEHSDVRSLKAYIDREAVLSSNNDLRSGETKGDGSLSFKAIPSAFLAVATKEGCSAGFAGFDEETGVLSVDTLIKPEFKGGLKFSIPTFVLACADPPEVGSDGTTDEAEPFEPDPPPPPSCDAEMCAAAQGHCEDDTCVVTCVDASCQDSGGSCMEGQCVVPPKCDEAVCAMAGGTCQEDACVTPACDMDACVASRGSCSMDGSSCDIPACFGAEADCTTAGGKCSMDGTTCELPACMADADCQAGQPGAFCDHPGEVGLAKCEPPEPGEITPPTEALGFTELRVTDSEGNTLADASEADARIADKDIPEDGLVRVYGKYSGPAEEGYLQVQTGGHKCARVPPRTDFIAVSLDDGVLESTENDYVELVLHGGCQKLQLTTSSVLGEGERSFVVDIGDRCAPPRHPFMAILTWDGGRRQPVDLDLNVWNRDGELVHVGHRQRRWGFLRRHGRGPGPEVFFGDEAKAGPFTIKVQFFAGRPRTVQAKLRVLRLIDGRLHDESFVFTLDHPKQVAEVGVFSME